MQHVKLGVDVVVTGVVVMGVDVVAGVVVELGLDGGGPSPLPSPSVSKPFRDLLIEI